MTDFGPWKPLHTDTACSCGRRAEWMRTNGVRDGVPAFDLACTPCKETFSVDS